MKNWKALAETGQSEARPTVWESEDVPIGNVLVQGYIVSDVETPEGEAMVEVPIELLREAVAKIVS